jgi:hypothetical protein
VSVRRLSTILESLLADTLRLPAAVIQVRLLRSWKEIVGPLLGGKTSPGRIRNGVLTVFVRNHAWAQELQLSTPALLERIRAFAGGETIREIRFSVDSGSCPPEETESLPGKDPAQAAVPAPHADDPLPPDPGDLEAVRDPETREILRSISRKSSRRRG